MLFQTESEGSQNIISQCHGCEKSFCQKNDLKNHVKSVHEKQKDLKSEFCEKSFSQKAILKLHVTKVHKGIKKCEFCGKSFSQAQHLKKHIHTIHEGHKDHKCESCGKSFSQAGHLEKNIHEGHKDHKCESQISQSKCSICGKNFLEKWRDLHLCATKKIFKCSMCEEKFFARQRVYTHVKQIHGIYCTEYPKYDKYVIEEETLNEQAEVSIDEMIEYFKCDICEKSFTEVGLQIHMNVVHSCGNDVDHIDDVSQITTAVVERHQNEIHENEIANDNESDTEEISYKCHICSKEFSTYGNLKKHTINVHEGKKTFKCEECNRGFADNHRLNRHKKSVHERSEERTTCSAFGRNFPKF